MNASFAAFLLPAFNQLPVTLDTSYKAPLPLHNGSYEGHEGPARASGQEVTIRERQLSVSFGDAWQPLTVDVNL
jgi:hypothetical protein